MDLCLKTTVHHVGLRRQAKSNKSCFAAKALRSKWSPVSSAKLVMLWLFNFSNAGWSFLSDTPQFVCLKSSEKFEKRTRETESLQISMAMPAITHRRKSAPYWLAKTSNWWVIRRTALTCHPISLLRGQQFSSPDAAVEAFKNYVLKVSQSECKSKRK